MANLFQNPIRVRRKRIGFTRNLKFVMKKGGWMREKAVKTRSFTRIQASFFTIRRLYRARFEKASK
jgi:hypothetical protein